MNNTPRSPSESERLFAAEPDFRISSIAFEMTTLSLLIFISTSGPPPKSWNPQIRFHVGFESQIGTRTPETEFSRVVKKIEDVNSLEVMFTQVNYYTMLCSICCI